MSAEKEFVFDRALTNAKTKPGTVKLHELVLLPLQFCHRNPEELKLRNLKLLRDSIVAEGLQKAIDYYVNPKKENVVLGGHRRVTTLRWLAEDKVAGFSHDMEIPANEVIDGNEVDLLLRSVSDNETGMKLDPISRIKVAKKLRELNVPNDRAARSLGVVTLTYLHDLLIAEHEWMYQYVISDCIQPTAAHRLLEAAKSKNRLDDLRNALDARIAEIKLTLALQERQYRELKGKDLPDAMKVIKNLLDSEIVSAWIAQIKANKPLSQEVTVQFAAGIDPKAHQLHIGNCSYDLENTDAKQLAKIASRLAMIAKTLPAYILRALSKAQDAPTMPMDDTSVLREAGLNDLADQIEKESPAAAKKEDDEEQASQEGDDEEEDEDPPSASPPVAPVPEVKAATSAQEQKPKQSPKKPSR